MRLRNIKWIVLLYAVLPAIQKVCAQVPVEKEAHHKIVLENQWVRVLEGRVPSHDTTPPHIHSANSVVVFLSSVTFGIQVIGQQPVVADIAAGAIRYLAYGDKPVNHIVWDQSDSALRFLVVELKKPAAETCPIAPRSGITLLWRQKQVTGYDWTPASGQQDQIPAAACARMVIVPTTGAFKFYPPNTPVKAQTHCYLLQF